jgi:predicted S18 family serine protease
MRGTIIAVLLIVITALAIPALAADDERYGYIKVENMDIILDKDQANINLEYTLDEPTRVIVLLLGKQDLKNRILKIVNYEDAKVTSLDMDRAELVVEDISYNYGRGIYWFPDHQFNVIIPTLRIITPQTSKEFSSTSEITHGMGYFDN